MAEAIASILVDQLATAAIETAIEHVRIALDAKDEVKELGKIFGDLKLVLEDAEHKQFTKDGVKPWLDEFKDVAYDMEDVLDEWKTELLRLQIEGTPPDENDPRYIKIKEKVSSSYLCFRFSNCFKQGVLYYNIGYRIKEIRKTLDSICERQKKFEFIKSQEPISDVYGISKHRETSSVLVDVSNIIPRDTDKEFIVKKLLGDESSQSENEKYDHRIISIIGLGGLGKTTLAQLIIKDDQVTAHFQKNIFWVCVSEPFDKTRIAKAIIDAAGESLPPNPEIWNSLHVKLCESVKGKLFLLVLDDVWTEDDADLNPLKDLLQLGAQGSRILVTTRKQGVAKTMNSVPYLLGLLSDDECWSLLRRKAFVGTEINDNQILNKIGFEIAKKCHGLPLTASILGGLLKTKKKNETEWRSILDSEIWKLKKIEENYFNALLLSYYNLPSALKRCFAYCVIFPKDHEIKKQTLIKMWMAQGFLNSSPTGEKLDAESIGEQYFNDLAEGSFFQEFTKYDYEDDDESIVSCKMHDLVHDFTQFLSKKQDINTPSLNDEHEVQSSSFLDTLMFEVKSLRTLLVLPECEHFSLINDRLCRPADFFHHLRCLRVLSLKNMNIEKLPSEIKELIHLRYLDLSGNESLTELPDSICNLFNLQTLELKFCRRLDKLPRGMDKMINLKHLCLMYTADNLVVPEEIGKLTSLLTLNKVNINGASGGSGLKVLKDLNLLQGELAITGLKDLKTANEASEAELNKKQGLRILSLNFNHGHEGSDGNVDAPSVELMESVLGALQPHPNLKTLSICSYGGRTFPVSWFASLTSLRSLTLQKCFNCAELPALGLLPSLKSLNLDELKNIKRIGVEICGRSFDQPIFPNLEVLFVIDMGGLEEFDLSVVEGSAAAGSNRRGGGEIIIMPRLIKITMWECPNLRTLGGLSKLQSLEELHLLQLDNLEELKSGGGRGRDDSTVINMLSLRLLTIIGCKKLKSSSLQQLRLPKLNKLIIFDCASLSDQLPISSAPNLTSLEISGASHSLPPQGLAGFKKLQHLRFNDCSFMTSIPEDVRHLTALQTLEIGDCEWPPSEIHPDCVPEQEDEEAWSIMSHIPKITIKRRSELYDLISTLTPTGTRQHSYTI